MSQDELAQIPASLRPLEVDAWVDQRVAERMAAAGWFAIIGINMSFHFSSRR